MILRRGLLLVLTIAIIWTYSAYRCLSHECTARITFYDASEGPYGKQSSTGTQLKWGHCAVDPRVIPYGSTVRIEGLGRFKAVDTGSAVVSRKASRRMGSKCPVVDVYAPSVAKARYLATNTEHFKKVTW